MRGGGGGDWAGNVFTFTGFTCGNRLMRHVVGKTNGSENKPVKNEKRSGKQSCQKRAMVWKNGKWFSKQERRNGKRVHSKHPDKKGVIINC